MKNNNNKEKEKYEDEVYDEGKKEDKVDENENVD